MKFRIPPQTHLERLKIAAMYLSLQRGLRRSAWGSCGWGAFTLVVGLLSRSHTAFDSVWAVIGLFLLLEGVWLLRASAADPRVLQLEGTALLVLGLWNTVGLYFEAKSGMKPLLGAQILFAGIAQLINSYTTFRSYPVYKQIYENLDRAVLHELEITIGDAWKRNVPEENIAEFQMDNKKCKAKFLSDLVILLTQGGKQVTLAERASVSIENTGNKMLSKALKVKVTLEDEKLKTEMNPDSYQRWQAWVSGSVIAATPASIVQN